MAPVFLFFSRRKLWGILEIAIAELALEVAFAFNEADHEKLLELV